MFIGSDGGTIPIALQVDDATQAHRIELDECVQPGRLGKLSFSVWTTTDHGARSQRCSSGPGRERYLRVPEQTFPHTGVFTLNIQVASGLLPPGDLYLRFY